MRLRDKIICFVCFLAAVSFFLMAGSQLDNINADRREMKLVINEPLENAPPSLAFATVAMGAFRGLVVDILWMRADMLKDKGLYFDAKQLADWITVLQPRFAGVWQFNAWNMAYNISVAIPPERPEERWRWVRNGYELLRDRGIKVNPKSVELYRELAMIFQHKIGGVTDEAHKYYKLQLAESMQPLLGPADNKYFAKLAQSPDTFEQIIADANVADFVSKLKAADEKFSDDEFFVSNYLTLREKPDTFKQEAGYVLSDFAGGETLMKFDIFANAYELRNTWKLEPEFMERLNKEYGPKDYDDPNARYPLDWRHPDTHAIYWAARGLETVTSNKFSVSEINADRMVFHSLQNLFRRGKIYIHTSVDPNSSEVEKTIFLRSDLQMFDSYNDSAMDLLAKNRGKEQARESSIESLEMGHRNMLINAAFSFNQSGNRKKAFAIFNQLRKLYPDKRFDKSFDKFIADRLKEELDGIGLTNAHELVHMRLMESYFRYAVYEDDEAYAIEQIAKQVYNLYQTSYRDENRIDLPDFDIFKYFALTDFFASPQYPADFKKSLFERIRIEKPELAKQFAKIEAEFSKQIEQQQKSQENE
ncbi:MAG: hypothetical protein ISS77_02760 [Phycisphaerae bacterium]|nr:hypothetical protein [Phycisphaerae bacterium]